MDSRKKTKKSKEKHITQFVIPQNYGKTDAILDRDTVQSKTTSVHDWLVNAVRLESKPEQLTYSERTSFIPL